jgi:uncharacterized membrane protein SpoIIM required for sporulation
MSKILALVIMGMMAVQIIKPLGLPGLRQRRDAWKLAVAALVLISLTVVLSHGQ